MSAQTVEEVTEVIPEETLAPWDPNFRPRWEPVRPNASEANGPYVRETGEAEEVAGWGRIRRLGQFDPPDEREGVKDARTGAGRGIRTPFLSQALSGLNRMSSVLGEMEPRQRADVVSAATVVLGMFLAFIGLWVWLGFGIALTTLGALVLGFGMWTAYDNHRPVVIEKIITPSSKDR